MTHFLLAEAWVHDLSPFIVKFSSTFGLRWYGTAYALGFVAGWLILRFMHKRGVTPVSIPQISDMMLALALGVILGGRVGHAVIYQQSTLTSFDASFPFWGLLKVNQGGMAFHGAVIGVMIAAWWVVRKHNKTVLAHGGKRIGWRHLMDLLAVASTPGLCLGRLANFVNGELFGSVVARPGEASPWWSVKFPQEMGSSEHWKLLHAAGKDAGFDAVLDSLRNPLVRQPEGMSEGMGTLIERAMDMLRAGGQTGNDLAQELAPFLPARHPSQLYQAFFEGVVLTALLWLLWRTPRRAGVVGCWFLIGYGVLRIIAETWRVPDEGIELVLGLSRGQWLSVAMVVGGGMTLAWIVRTSRDFFGGWLVSPARRER